MKYFTLTLLLIPILFLSNGYTQDWTTWSLPDGAKRRIGKGNISFQKFSPNGTTLVSGGGDSTILLWDWERIARTTDR